MISRRQALTLAAVAGLAAGCGTTSHPTSAVGAATVTCPDPIPGTLGTFTGNLGATPWQPVDAFARKDGIAISWQYPVVLSDKPNAGLHYRANQRVPNERWLILSLAGGDTSWVDAPYPPTPLRMAHDVDYYIPEGGTVGYSCFITRVVHSATCKPTTANPTGGYVEFTEVSDDRVAGRVELDFGAAHVAGDFTAPALTLCAPLPGGKPVCVSG